MPFARSVVVILLSSAVALPGLAQTPEITRGPNHGVIGWFEGNYVAHPVPKISFEDSPRIDKLMRAGNIYLSLRDAIALALENNLDIEYARYNPKLADANSQRVSAGALLRNVSSSISSGPSSASLGVAAQSSLGSAGTSTSASSGGQGGVLSGLSVQLAGTAIPNLDPVFYASGQFSHSTQIETATNITGTNYLVSQYKSATYGIQQGFLTGTSLQLGMGNTLGVTQNSPYNLFTPYSQSTLQLAIQQNLLQGFRPSVNNRAIRVAKNQRHISDLTFKNQVMTSVANVVSLYWDLVTFNEDLKVKQHTFELNKKLYEDNQRRAELGAIAPIDIIQAEAEMKSSQQDVVTAELQVLQQEMILKSVLTRGGMDNMAVVGARIVPTDHIDVPAQEAVRPIQDLVADALANRPDVEQNAIGLEDARITTLGVKDAMLPQLTGFATFSNSGLAGQVNTQPYPVTLPNGQTVMQTRTAADVNQYFLGGYGTVLGQVFGRNFPNYSAGLSLTITLRNRSTQADLITDQLNYRQQQLQDKQLHNSIKLNVINAQTAVRQARAAWETSVEARKLQEQTLAGTQRKYELGTSTILDVVIVQRDTTTRELAEIDARNQYNRARTNLRSILGTVLTDYNVDIEQAKTGLVGREPDPIPAVPAAAPGSSAAIKR
ncbi:MAG: TolC family protein [Bryobacteraceae bacterium]|jgi:outer membrane protein TolC